MSDHYYSLYVCVKNILSTRSHKVQKAHKFDIRNKLNKIKIAYYNKFNKHSRISFFFHLSSLQCWDQCTQNTKINTNLNAWPLRTVSMVRNESLVTADVAWQLLNTPCQYLVTWEISGGGLKGNLITETPSVQLSLWPETVYRVQVTCRNKVSQSFDIYTCTEEKPAKPIIKPFKLFASIDKTHFILSKPVVLMLLHRNYLIYLFLKCI